MFAYAMPYGYRELQDDLLIAKKQFESLNFGEEPEFRNLNEGENNY